MAIVIPTILPEATADVPMAANLAAIPPALNSVIVSTTILPAPVIAVVSCVPSLIPAGSGSAVVVTIGLPSLTVQVDFAGAWPTQENFPAYSYRYIQLPSTVLQLANTIESIPLGATIVGYTADPTLFKTNTWTIGVSDGTAVLVTQKVNNNFSTQSLKLQERMGTLPA